LPSESREAFCNYCGTKFIISTVQEEKTSPSIETLFKLAETAMQGRNYEEANKYCDRILEQDPENVNAWFGKVLSVGWLTTLDNPRLFEMVAALDKLLALVPIDDQRRNKYISKSNETIISVARTFYKMSLDYAKNIITANNNAWGEFGNHVVLITGLINGVLLYDPKNVKALQLGIEATKTLIEGVASEDNQSRYTVALEPNTEAKMRSVLSEYCIMLKQIQPDFQSPVIEKAETGCFIATATMQDYNHPYVLTLRKFRDQILLNSLVGRNFIKLYYLISPPIAKILNKSEILRRISSFIVIKPLVQIANGFLSKGLS